MKLFKTTDEKFEEIGFKKIGESNYMVRYERMHKQAKYTQSLEFYETKHGCIIHSYVKNSFDQEGIENSGVAMTPYEMKLCIKKTREKGFTIKKV